MAPEHGAEKSGLPDVHRDADAAHAVLAAVAQIGLALHESHQPIAEIGSMLARLAETLRQLQPELNETGGGERLAAGRSIEQLQAEVHKGIEQLQFYDRMAQHLSRLQSYLIDVANQLADPGQSGACTAQGWSELRTRAPGSVHEPQNRAAGRSERRTRSILARQLRDLLKRHPPLDPNERAANTVTIGSSTGALTAMLKLEHIYKTFDGKAVLTDVSLTVPKGVTHALIGSSGSGKTTLLRVTLGLIPFDKGYVKINDQALLSFKPAEWADRIGYVPQDGGLFPHITGRQNVALIPSLRAWDRARIDTRLEELRRLVDLDASVLRRFPHEMSGGQKQRVAIMRAAMMDPPVMLLDEPMAALDPLIRRSLQQELKSIFQRLGKTVLVVTHDLGEAVYLAERLTLLHEGRVVQTGSYRDLLLNPADPMVTLFINAQRTLPDARELE
jgi:osmoprotectant transport system ATP-binding protein